VSSALHWLGYTFGFTPADTQTTDAERACLARGAAGKRAIVELGVYHGVSTRVMRSVMAPDGVITAVDPYPPGRLGVSFERMVAMREAARVSRGTVRWARQMSFEAAAGWREPIDFVFVDGDHSWAGIERDWRDWTPHVVAGGVVALHDSRSVAWRADLDSVRFTRDVVARDPRFREVDAADSLTLWERRPD
jgi:predicted O-methyltransferase YrrM